MPANHKITMNSLYFTGLVLLAMSLPLSKYTTGLFQFFLLVLWLIWGIQFKKSVNVQFVLIGALRPFSQSFVQKLKRFLKNKTALLLSSLYLVYLTGLIGGGDFNYVLTDLRIKLPLLILPLILAGLTPITQKQLKILLWIFVGAVLIGTGFSAAVLFSKSFSDIREISVFISPVRFALTICFAVVILFNSIRKNEIESWKIKILFLALILWFIFMLLKLESGIGMVILSVLLFIFVLRLIFKSANIFLKLGFVVALIAGFLVAERFAQNEVKDFYTPPEIEYSKLDRITKSGNTYLHDTLNFVVEDGKYPGLFLCETELEKSWNNRSLIDYHGKDKQGQEVRSTLIRFLTSKGFRKDKEGVEKLSDEEIKFIENGIANANYVYNPGLKTRISKILFGYQVYLKTSDPGSNSLTLRLTHWKAALGIIKENFWWGVGSGHIPQAFNKQYNRLAPKLAPEKRMESHNQYLHVFLNLGLFGFSWFLLVLLYPGFNSGEIFHFNYAGFLIIVLISMLTEDTLETQSGVTFFAFFNTLFLLHSPQQSTPK